MFNIKSRKWLSALSALLICLFLGTLLAIPATAQDGESNEALSNTYVRVDGFSQLYQVMTNGTAQNPPVFVWGLVNQQGNNTVMPAVLHNGSYYLTLMNTGLFLGIEAGSPMDGFDFEFGFIWHGPDGILGTDDDEVFSVDDILDDVLDNMEGMTAEMWNTIGNFIPGWPQIEATSEEADDGDDEDDDEDDEDKDDKDDDVLNSTPGLPQTGLELTPGAMIAAAIIALGAGYVGISYAKKVKDDKAAA